MPYKDTSELPKSVRDALPSQAQSIFLAAFNSAVEQGKDEETAFKISWGAVKKSYKKVGDNWEPIKNLQKLAMFMNVEIMNANHDAILQTLNRDIGGYYFSSEVFANNVQDWSNIPIVYATDHPDIKLFAENPKLALAKIKGRIVGQVTIPRIETIGHPRLMANMEIDDGEVNRLIDEGKISHSTGFIGMVDGKNVIGVTPNHVLVFQEDENNIPKDRGAFILNKQEVDIKMAKKEYSKEDMDAMLDFMKANPGMMDKTTMDKMYAAMDGANQKEYMKGVLKDLQSHPEMMDDEMKSMMKGMNNKETIDTMGKEDELSKQLEISNKEKETLTGEIEGFKKLIADKDAQLKVFAQKEAETLKATRESQWQKIKEKIPVGQTHKAEDEAKLKSEFESDPYGFAVKLTEFKNATGTQKDGVEFSQQEGDDAVKDEQAAINELRQIGGMNRRRI